MGAINFSESNVISLAYVPNCNDDDIKNHYLNYIGDEEDFDNLTQAELDDIESEINQERFDNNLSVFKHDLLYKMKDELQKIKDYVLEKFNYDTEWAVYNSNFDIEFGYNEGFQTILTNSIEGYDKNIPQINNLMYDYLNYAIARIGFEDNIPKAVASWTQNTQTITKDDVDKLEKQDFSKLFELQDDIKMSDFARNHNLGNFKLLDKQDEHQR